MPTPQECATTLNYLLAEGRAPGLLPKTVAAAAKMLIDQSEEIKSLTAALATKRHTVTATAKRPDNYSFRTELEIELVAADPRRYFSELSVDTMNLQQPDYLPYAARSMAKAATAEWIQEIERKALAALAKAVRDMEALERAE